MAIRKSVWENLWIVGETIFLVSPIPCQNGLIQESPFTLKPKDKIMKKYTQEELNQALKDGVKDFSGCDLSGLDLSTSYLFKVNFFRAYCFETNFCESQLSQADFRYAVLVKVDFSRASLVGAHFGGANLSCSNLREANLREADLYNTQLFGVNLEAANLRGSDLRGAALEGAIFGPGWKIAKDKELIDE